jgi:hypothetical protein
MAAANWRTMYHKACMVCRFTRGPRLGMQWPVTVWPGFNEVTRGSQCDKSRRGKRRRLVASQITALLRGDLHCLVRTPMLQGKHVHGSC